MGYITGGSASVIPDTTKVSGSLWFVNTAGYTLTVSLLGAGNAGTGIPCFTIDYSQLIRALHFFCQDEVGFPATNTWALFNTNTASMFSNTASIWNHVAFAFDCNHTNLAGDLKIGKVVVNGANATNIIYTPGGGDPNQIIQMRWSDIAGGVGVPVHPQYIAPSSIATPMAQVQIWPGSFNDPTNSSNFNQYLTISGGVATPAPSSISHAAFGVPAFEFIGNTSQFPINRGYGGAFTTTGTINSFSPLPSY